MYRPTRRGHVTNPCATHIYGRPMYTHTLGHISVEYIQKAPNNSDVLMLYS